MKFDRSELETMGRGELRKLAQENGLTGYPGWVASKNTAIGFLTGELTYEAIVADMIDRRPNDTKFLDWLERNGYDTPPQPARKNVEPEGSPNDSENAGAPNDVRFVKPHNADPRQHEHWHILELTASAMGINLVEYLDRAKQNDEHADRIAELESLLKKLQPAEHNDPDGWGVDPRYIPTPQAKRAKRLIERGRPVYLVGPAGSGKSMALRWACKELKRKMIFISMHEDQQADVLEGYSWLTSHDGATIMQWCEGVIQKALETGSILLVDEFDRAPTSIQHLLNDVAQSGSYTIKEGPHAGEKITAKPGFLVIATGNTVNGSTGQYSSTAIDKSTLSRFRVIYINFDENAEKRILDSLGLDKDQASSVRAIVSKARALWERGDLPVVIGTRHLIHVAEDLLDGFTLEEAWEQNASMMQGDPTDPFFTVCQDLVAQTA